MKKWAKKHRRLSIFLGIAMVALVSYAGYVVNSPVVQAASSCGPNTGLWEMPRWCGYFNHQFDDQGEGNGAVIDGGITDYNVTGFVNNMHSRLFGSDARDKVGAAFIVSTMMGKKYGDSKSIVTAQNAFNSWAYQVKLMDANKQIDWNGRYDLACGKPNTYWQGTNHNDVAAYIMTSSNDMQCGTSVPAINFTDTATGFEYHIKRGCGNPVGKSAPGGMPDDFNITASLKPGSGAPNAPGPLNVNTTYTLNPTACNTGQAIAPSEKVVVALPSYVSYVAGSATHGGTYDATARAITWTLTQLGSGNCYNLFTFQIKTDANSAGQNGLTFTETVSPKNFSGGSVSSGLTYNVKSSGGGGTPTPGGGNPTPTPGGGNPTPTPGGGTAGNCSGTPSVSIGVSPQLIEPGESSTLVWGANNFTTGSITNVGAISGGGSRSVSPPNNTTYTLTATCNWTTTGYRQVASTCSRTVIVNKKPVVQYYTCYVTVPYTVPHTASASASVTLYVGCLQSFSGPPSVTRGDKPQLSWVMLANASSANITNTDNSDTDAVSPFTRTGSMYPRTAPAYTVTYTITAQCVGYTRSLSARVIVYRYPGLRGMGNDVHAGGSASDTNVCSAFGSASITGNGHNTYGQYVTSATGSIIGFGSNNGSGNLANLGSSGGYNVVCRPDLASRAPGSSYTTIGSSVDLGTLSADGVYYYSGSELNLYGTYSHRITIVSEANIHIDSDIRTASILAIGRNQPSLGVIAKGNIYIGGGSDRTIDAYLFANDVIDTCASGDCTNALYVNGFMMADTLVLRRLGHDDRSTAYTDGEVATMTGQLFINPPQLFQVLSTDLLLRQENERPPLK